MNNPEKSLSAKFEENKKIEQTEQESSGQTLADSIERLKGENKQYESVDGSVLNLESSTASVKKMDYASVSIRGSELRADEVVDSVIRLVEQSQAGIAELSDSVLRIRDSQLKVETVSDSLIRIEENVRAAIEIIKDTVVRVKAGSVLEVRRAENCRFNLEAGARLNLLENIDSLVNGLGEYTQSQEGIDKSDADVATAQALEQVRKQLNSI